MLDKRMFVFYFRQKNIRTYFILFFCLKKIKYTYVLKNKRLYYL